MSDKKTIVLLASIFAVALLAFVGVAMLSKDDTQGAQLRLEVAKAALQVMVIGVLGTALKLLADDYQVRRQRAVERDEFRRDKYRRLVAVTSELRVVPVFIRANRSVKTWNEQMETVLKADAQLRQIKHEIFSSASTREPPFPNHDAIVDRLEQMFGYTTWVAEHFANRKKELGEEQRLAEEDNLPPDERDGRQRRVWERLCRVPSVRDLVQTPPLPSSEPANDPCAPSSTGKPSWAGYQEDESCVLHLMLQTSFGSRA